MTRTLVADDFSTIRHAWRSCAASASNFFEHRVEDRSKIAGRGIDDLQYLGSRGLLLQCLPRLGEEPSILHCNDRLRSEILQQRDLLVGERSHLATIDGKVAQYSVVLEQRHAQQCANAAEIGCCPRYWVAVPVGVGRGDIVRFGRRVRRSAAGGAAWRAGAILV